MKAQLNELQAPQVYINYVRPEYDSMKRVHSSEECVDIIRKLNKDHRIDYKEYFWVILMNASASVLGVSQISEGSDMGTVASTKEILQLAILSHARAIILVHNHPAGSLMPSSTDRVLTKKIHLSLELFQIELNDHIIITKEGILL